MRSNVFPQWLGWLAVTVALLYILGLLGRFIWSHFIISQAVAFFLFLFYMIMLAIRLLVYNPTAHLGV